MKYVLVVFCFMFIEKSDAQDFCGVQPLSPELPIEIVQLAQEMIPKCNSQTVESFSGERTTKVHRTSTRCAHSWPVRLEDGTVLNLPAGSRIVELASINSTHSSILIHQNGKVLMGEIAKESFLGKKDCLEKESINPEVFIEEARFHLEISKGLNKAPIYHVPADKSYIAQAELKKIEDKLNQKIAAGKITSSGLEKLSKNWNSELSILKEKNKPEAISYGLNLIKSSFSPVDAKTGEAVYDKNLIMPLSTEWFYSNPRLKEFFLSNWGDLAQSFEGGTGGEVWEKLADKEAGAAFDKISDLLEKTKIFVEKSGDKELINSAEFKWLKDLSNIHESNINQIITIHKESFQGEACLGCFVSYIPVDQSIGGIKSNEFLSILLHESGQGNNVFFKDTHVDHEVMEGLRHCVLKNGAKHISQDPYTIQALFGYSSQLSAVYTKMLIDRID